MIEAPLASNITSFLQSGELTQSLNEGISKEQVGGAIQATLGIVILFHGANTLTEGLSKGNLEKTMLGAMFMVGGYILTKNGLEGMFGKKGKSPQLTQLAA